MRFYIDIFSPDGEFTKEEICSAMEWLFNHDGKAIRGFYEVIDIKELKIKERRNK